MPASPPPDSLIDAHSHVWTSDTTRYPLAAGFRRPMMVVPDFPPEELLRYAQPVGVKRVVLIQPNFYGYDNSYMLDVIRANSARYVGVAVIDQDGPRPDVAMRGLAAQGIRGFRIYPKNQGPGTADGGDWLSSAAMQQMWTTAAEENLAICCLVDPPDLPAIDRMCGEFPDTPVVIDHLGHVAADPATLVDDLVALQKLAAHPRVSVKISAFYGLGERKPPYADLTPMIRSVYDVFGPQRMMWASDCPYQVLPGQGYRESIDLIREHLDFLTDDDRLWLLRKTAERVFFHSRGTPAG